MHWLRQGGRGHFGQGAAEAADRRADAAGQNTLSKHRHRPFLLENIARLEKAGPRPQVGVRPEPSATARWTASRASWVALWAIFAIRSRWFAVELLGRLRPGIHQP